MAILARLKAMFRSSRPERAQEHVLRGDDGGPETVLDLSQVPQMPERRNRARNNARPGTKMLIIDDSRTVIAALKAMLVSVGYQVLSATDAAKGVALARTDQPDLIFLDIVMPGMNGFAALRVLRREPWTRRIPVIMISGNSAAAEQYYANQIGADDFMKKPFSRFEVFARIECLLGADFVPRRWDRDVVDATPAHIELGSGTVESPERITAGDGLPLGN
jgi:twitching motility two-component system response regulator PilH